MIECQQFCVIQLNNLDAVECLLPARIHLHFSLFSQLPCAGCTIIHTICDGRN